MNREKGLESAIVITLVLLVAGLRFNTKWPIVLAIVLLGLTFVSKKLTIAIGKGWFAFSHYFGLVMNYLVMFVLFFVVLTPLAFFQRLLGKNHILKKTQSDSHFRMRQHLFASRDLERPW
jgi:predicted membrane protein